MVKLKLFLYLSICMYACIDMPVICLYLCVCVCTRGLQKARGKIETKYRLTSVQKILKSMHNRSQYTSMENVF